MFLFRCLLGLTILGVLAWPRQAERLTLPTPVLTLQSKLRTLLSVRRFHELQRDRLRQLNAACVGWMTDVVEEAERKIKDDQAAINRAVGLLRLWGVRDPLMER
jgi:hypothetical protein